MRIATWNVNGLRARQDFVLHWLRARRPDIVALQELKLTDEQFPRDVFAAAGYQVVLHGQKAWNGVAVLSHAAATVTQSGLPGAEDIGARLITADVAGVSFTSVYCPNGKHTGHDDFQHKLAWYDRLLDHLRGRHDPERAAVVGGDFNICPSGLDSYDEAGLRGQIFHTDEERARFQALLDWGLIDLYRHLNPAGREYSWWDYRGGAFHKQQGLRIDFLLATKPLLGRVRRVEIDREYRKKKDDLTPSDHAPVLAELADEP
jgi:exodeoxyribonuclease-3